MSAFESLEASLHRGHTLATGLFAFLAPALLEEGASPEALWLSSQAGLMSGFGTDLSQTLANWQLDPPIVDARLHRLACAIELNSTELIAVALALAADTDVIAGRALAWLQAPQHDAHPTVGLVVCLDGQRGAPMTASLAALLDGQAIGSGLLKLDVQGRALPDVSLRIPLPLVLALAGGEGQWPGVQLGGGYLPPLAPSLRIEASHRARSLGIETNVLAVRSGHPLEARSACAEIARSLNLRPAFVEGDPPPGLTPWLILHNALPVFCAELAPGERRLLPRLPSWRGPTLVAGGNEGCWIWGNETLASWQVPVPSAKERVDLWRSSGMAEDSAVQLGNTQRHASARITELARSAEILRMEEAGIELSMRHVVRASRSTGRGLLGSLADLLSEDIEDDALVLTDSMRTDLHGLAMRCRVRDGLADSLGPAARARYRPGVRALLVGVSGTGKTMACGWLATHLGMPLYRVDLASVTSKYIGETEKNLGELFARAEHAEVILLFDEADSLFGKRTEVKDANDRFANQQTNYLLQRIESFDGIVLLTSNSRNRFDSAFTRRLDAILEFPTPGPEERKSLWLAHLGEQHTLSPSEINRLAVGCELVGGHIRNVTLAAKALAHRSPIGTGQLAPALAAEYRKLGKQMPTGLFANIEAVP
ncbi:MAG: ATP-binding protein [Candidatus Methylumidiphilus sp.]